MQYLRRAVFATVALASGLLAQGKNVLFYGNSLSLFNGGVAPLVRAMAIAAGQPTPFCQAQCVNGVDLHFHATDPAQVAAITNTLPQGQHWDVVVLQGISHETTTTLGNPAHFVADAITIVGNVRNHSPQAKTVLFQTYARAQGHAWYPGTFANPMVMHNQVRTTYRNTVTALEAAFGPGKITNSAVGDCAALLEFNPVYYNVDLQHPANSLTVMSAMCLFTSIYTQLASNITPTLTTSNPLGALLLNYGIGLAEWHRLAGIADQCAKRSVRPHPGSGDQLLLETGTQAGYLSALATETVTTGTSLDMRVSSRNGVFATAPTWLVARLFPTGQAPLPPTAFPELAVGDSSFAVLLTAPSLATPIALTVQMPFTFPGASIMLQGIAFGPSTETGNPLFATTDGHELVFQ